MSLCKIKFYWVVGNENSSVFELTNEEMLQLLKSGVVDKAPEEQKDEFMDEFIRRQLHEAH